ncbi:hypothetical protein TraAM80_01597 [Trypanosoma rangeli]|uniref:Uncharacterized protein n=1 Tax=Trypanosoma rangeli TaxID=5698 RepID=A0A3R7NRA6_TRYRA|nr:uncharacterized protein TraAM80_01597 [Trypanosoma rangeli]RNF10424.1 hypothetical protein TraAM80_01597 [Trypanosoma rangeli]|eukprot:RNF10424.1 hypothetical protein TraAM80_01597 [Trypanosoma rangeli]
MIGGTQVVQVVRAVANGDGDWADVPRCVREAILLALTGPQSQTARGIGAATEAAAAAAAAASVDGGAAERRHRNLWPESHEGTRVAAVSLTEEVIQRSVRTFEDAAWVRDQAVRSFAQFHNNIEETREAMRHHLRALWRTAAQLDPTLLRKIRQECNLRPGDDVPDGVVIPAAALRRLQEVEAMVDEVAEGVEALRWASVRFAANVLSDEEKQAMGLDPADLRPEDVLLGHTPPCGSGRMYTAAQNSPSGDGNVPHALLDPPRKSHEPVGSPEKSSTPSRLGDGLTLSERRERYMSRIALLNEASIQQKAEEELSRHRSLHSTKGSTSQHCMASESPLSSPGSQV